MEKYSLDYSAKNIPVPSENNYHQTMLTKANKFIQNARWKAFFFLNPQEKPQNKQFYNFKSTNPAPPVNRLKEFENRFA